MKRLAFVRGVGKTKFGLINKTLAELMYEAIFEAIGDAKININEVGAIYIGNYASSLYNNQLHLGSLLASLLPGLSIPIVRCENACASGGTAVYEGIMALSRFENVVVVGVEKMNDASAFDNGKYISLAGDFYFDYKEGVLFPVAYALLASEYMKKYGLTSADLNLVSLKNHQNANLNKKAHFYGSVVDLERIKKSPIIATPLNLYDCSPISDGAAAVVMSKNKTNKRDVAVIGSVLQSGMLSFSQSKDLTRMETSAKAAEIAYGQAGVTAKDIDLAQVHDCFTIAEVLAMEDLRFCKRGEAKDLIRAGETKIGGRIPINTDGGLKGGGHPLGATGVSQVTEVTCQLRGEAGKRQVTGAKLGLTHNVGGTGGTCVIHILSKD